LLRHSGVEHEHLGNFAVLDGGPASAGAEHAPIVKSQPRVEWSRQLAATGSRPGRRQFIENGQ